MAKTITEEELQIRKRARRRLIGAIALVTMVVVFLPMVLDHEPKRVSQDVSIRIPSPGSVGTFTSKIVPVVPAAPDAASAAIPGPEIIPPPPTAPNRPVPASKAPPVNDTEAAPPKSVSAEKSKPPAKSAVSPTVKPPAKSAPAPKAAEKAQPDAKGTGTFVVQVAALNDADKAKEMQQKIAATGVKSYTEVVPTAKGNVTRVRAGPFASREEADKMRDKLKDIGLSGNVVPK